FLHLYLDASLSKYFDPSHGWSSSPLPPVLPALDTYTRHTPFARVVYTLLGPSNLALLTPTVVYGEMLLVPLAILLELLQNYFLPPSLSPPTARARSLLIYAAQFLHCGIGLCV
ncbi:hypothetical protein TrRE_jg13545, partial [Triparma retinervis]